jgi:hypothetical protein
MMMLMATAVVPVVLVMVIINAIFYHQILTMEFH